MESCFLLPIIICTELVIFKVCCFVNFFIWNLILKDVCSILKPVKETSVSFYSFCKWVWEKCFHLEQKKDTHTCVNSMRDSTKLFYTFCICNIETYSSTSVSSSIKEYWDTAGSGTQMPSLSVVLPDDSIASFCGEGLWNYLLSFILVSWLKLVFLWKS